MAAGKRSWTLPRDAALGLMRIENCAGLSISALPNGCIFAIEHRREGRAAMINQVLGSPLGGGIGRIYLRSGGPAPLCIEMVGPGANVRFAASQEGFAWEGEAGGLRHRVSLHLHPRELAWFWCIGIDNKSDAEICTDTILIQDLGLGDRGFLMTNEAYASQYIDHHIGRHEVFGPIIMSRQNLPQDGRHPWAAHGCLDGAKSFATDGLQLFGPRFRDGNAFVFLFGTDLPGSRLQHELACAAIQSLPAALPPGGQASWRFFGLFDPDHAAPSSDRDLERIDGFACLHGHRAGFALAAPARSLVQGAPGAAAEPLNTEDLARIYPGRTHEEHLDGTLLSFFVSDPPHNRHVVLSEKERLATRRHGTILRSGQAMLPGDETLCATCWMHGVFAAQLAIGNTSFHKLFSVSRDPYNIMRTSGLRMMIEGASGWQFLTVPSAFEMGLSDCRWIYRLKSSLITVHAIASGKDPAMHWRVSVEGEPCKFLVFGHLAGGEREFDNSSIVEVDPQQKRFSLRPDPQSLWGQRYPEAVYYLVTSTPEAIEAIGGNELLYGNGRRRDGAYVAVLTQSVRDFCFAVTGSMTSSTKAAQLAEQYEQSTGDGELLLPARQFWSRLTRGVQIKGSNDEARAVDSILPWLAHNAMIHLSAPHGLEQYSGAAWGTRDACQGPVELLLALEHDVPVKEILRIVFAQQYESGDFPQWFMLEPYSIIQDRTSHGDVIVWPLKALNDYIEVTGDLDFLSEPVPWRRIDTLERTARKDAVIEHIRVLLDSVQARFIPGTHLICYGEGDWNDSLQPADPKMRDWMVSSWTVALLFQQLNRYAGVLSRAGLENNAADARMLASKMREDFNRYLIADGTVAGYALFDPAKSSPELLIHPRDTRTGLKYSLLPMTRGILGGLFTLEQIAHHLRIVREHLLYPDGAHLLDRPIVYHGGLETAFRRAESAAFFGREIGLMYVHAHLRYAEAMALLGDAAALWGALLVANPISVTERLSQARLRQRNAYFSSSDAAFPDRYAASAEWPLVKEGAIGFEGGWRIYSSGPGIYINLLICHVLGRRRIWGKRTTHPLIPESLAGTETEWGSLA